MEIYNLITIIVVITAVFGYINFKFIKLPATIGIMLISVIASLIVIGIGYMHPKFFHIGALISPTDPIAVLGILKQANIPQSLETKITGESLFNDGVAVVVFTTITEVMRTGISNVSAGNIIWLFLEEACGGFVFGLLLGYTGFLALKSINNYTIEVLITLAIVMGGYSLADYLHISGPLAIVAAGIVTGNTSLEYGTSEVTRDYMTKFWEMIDEVMNAILFLLIGFEMLVVPFTRTLVWLGCAAILIVLAARFLSVALPIEVLKQRRSFERNAIAILTWGGLRGGISVALALSLPYNETNRILVSVTYFVVLFSILVQGLTIGRFARKLAA